MCAFTCGTPSALERHRANVHSLRASTQLAAAIAPQARMPQCSGSEGSGLGQLREDEDDRHSHTRASDATAGSFGSADAGGAPRTPMLARANTTATSSSLSIQAGLPTLARANSVCSQEGSLVVAPDTGTYAEPSISWLRACAVANAARARARMHSEKREEK